MRAANASTLRGSDEVETIMVVGVMMLMRWPPPCVRVLYVNVGINR
jgi:hypothetical protein